MISRRTHLLLTGVLALYGLCVLVVTLGKSLFVVGSLWTPSEHHLRTLKLIPLETLFFASPWWGGLTNLLGNIALFVPVGMLLGLRYYRYFHGVRRATLVGFVLSLGIETVQYIGALGYSDINDLAFNTAGTWLGAWLIHTGKLRMWHAVFGTLAAVAAIAGIVYYWARLA